MKNAESWLVYQCNPFWHGWLLDRDILWSLSCGDDEEWQIVYDEYVLNICKFLEGIILIIIIYFDFLY